MILHWSKNKSATYFLFFGWKMAKLVIVYTHSKILIIKKRLYIINQIHYYFNNQTYDVESFQNDSDNQKIREYLKTTDAIFIYVK
jgi:hypothetical protein